MSGVYIDETMFDMNLNCPPKIKRRKTCLDIVQSWSCNQDLFYIIYLPICFAVVIISQYPSFDFLKCMYNKVITQIQIKGLEKKTEILLLRWS